jgi:soluble cytochrome b562
MSTRLSLLQRIGVFTVFLMISFTLGLIGGRSLVEPRAEAVGPAAIALLSPLMDFVKFLATKVKPKGSDAQTFSKGVSEMDSEATLLALIPKYLVASRSFRTDAIELANFASAVSQQSGMEDTQWGTLKSIEARTRKSFDGLEKAPGASDLLLQFPDMQQAIDTASRDLNAVENIIASTDNSAKSDMKLDKVKLIVAHLANITTAAQWSEYQVASSTSTFVNGYKKLATSLKKPTQKAPSGNANSTGQAAVSGPRLVSVALVENESATTEPEYLLNLRKEIQQPVTAPTWIATLSQPTHGALVGNAWEQVKTLPGWFSLITLIGSSGIGFGLGFKVQQLRAQTKSNLRSS